ncbi:site-specific integrase [Roseateles sp. DAIF2]|nr:site-specific integrase [Roseateles sp. DAIF2]
MARLEYVTHTFFNVYLSEDGVLTEERQHRAPIDKLPQIFWSDGLGWAEANVWALTRAAEGIKLDTVKRNMKYLLTYANYLEGAGLDWRDFPLFKEEQAIRKYRGELVRRRDGKSIAPKTARNSMASAIQFYRYADKQGLVNTTGPMWDDTVVQIQRCDIAGFKRSISRNRSELSIPCRSVIGQTLEDGLLPLTKGNLATLLSYVKKHESQVLLHMLTAGAFSGARIGTVTTMTVDCLDTDAEHGEVSGLYMIPVGPGTGIATKFDVTGRIPFPEAVLDDLRYYASSTERLLREAKAEKKHKRLLFLNKNGKPYTVDAVNRLVWDMRQRAVKHGLKFCQRLRFHQTRATYGTWLMRFLLDNGAGSDAIRIVRDAMLHQSETTTMRYVKFLEMNKFGEIFAEEFNSTFTGMKRDWNAVEV